MTIEELRDWLQENVPSDEVGLRRCQVALVFLEDDCFAIDLVGPMTQRIGEYASAHDLVENGLPALKAALKSLPEED